MAMHKVPTLVLGIGGIGCRIAANISDLLTDEARERVGIIGIDTNVNDLNAIAARGVRTIQTSDDRTVGEYLMHNPEHLPWFPLNNFTAAKSLLNGAGQIRAVSRLGALATEEKGGFIPIKEEIQRIRANRGDSSNGNLTVMVVGSITGGTGAGLFLQLPYYVRKVMYGESGLKNIIIRGMFVGPDLTADVQPSSINRDAVRVNGYSCIKELNALYMRQMSSQNVGNLKVDFYAPATETEQRSVMDDIRSAWEGLGDTGMDYGMEAVSSDAKIIAQGNPDIPYDYLYLIEGSNADGGIGIAPLDSVESLAARMVHTLMFTPVSNNALSIEDNMILQDAANNGMNRYSSAGMTRLIYPQEQAREYVTLSTVRDLVQSEWLVIDNSYQDQVAEARSRQSTDGQVKIPQLKYSYTTFFREQIKGKGNLGKLYSEAYVINDKREATSRASLFMTKITALVNQVTNADNVKAAKEACKVVQELKTVKKAASEFNRVYMALEDYEKLAKRLIDEKPATIANTVFPPSWQSMRQNKENPSNIYQLLSSVHPLTARFLCYDLIQQLENKIVDLEKKDNSKALGNYLKVDYDPDEEETQTASEALQKVKDTQIPLLGVLKGNNARINRIKMKLTSSANSYQSTVTKYLQNQLEYAVYQILLERLEKLAENYAIFFRGIGTMIEENKTRIANLEALTMPLGQIGVYCSKEAFQMIAAEYRNNVDCALPAETKTAIFESLFKIQAEEFANESKIQTERQRAARAAKKTRTLNSVFQTAVVDTIRTSVIKKGGSIVDMNIREALERQFQLEAPERDDFDNYLQTLIRRAMKMAAPMVATTGNAAATNTATAYLAIHPNCAATEMGEPNVGATQTLFAPTASAETGNVKVTVLLDDAFSPYEITCFRAKYKFSIEDLTKYAPSSENALAYERRVSSLGQPPLHTGNPDDCLTVINPHLDRYWHEEAYLPAIYKSERARDRLDTYKAFIYAMGLDVFQLLSDENTLDKNGNSRLTWYVQTGRGFSPVKVRNSHIGNSYTDLFNSLPYNGRIKSFILNLSQRVMNTRKGYSSAEELFEEFAEDPFLSDLFQVSGEGDMNILDILLSMRNGMEPEDWSMLFTGLQEVLWEYCAFLFDKNERMVNHTVRTVLDTMLANSSIAGREDLNYSERELKSRVETLRSMPYKRK